MANYKWVGRISRVFVDEVVKSPVGRLSFPSLVEPKGGEIDGKEIEPKYQGNLLIDKNSPELDWFVKQMNHHKNQMLALYNKNSSTKIGDCDLWKDGDRVDLEKYPQNKNTWTIIAKHKDPVKCYNEKRERIDPKDLAGGMLVRFALRPHLGPTGLSYYLEGVQRIKDDGVRFGGANRDYSDVFDVLEEGAEVFVPESPETNGYDETASTFDEVGEGSSVSVAEAMGAESANVAPPAKSAPVTGDAIKAAVAAKIAQAKGKAAAKNLLGNK